MLSYHEHSLLERNPQHTSALIGGTSHLPNLYLGTQLFKEGLSVALEQWDDHYGFCFQRKLLSHHRKKYFSI
jgi:hypothetical protein